MNIQLSEHFSFYELTNSQNHPELVENNRKEAMEYLENLKALCSQLEILRAYYGKAITITNGFRGVALNKAVGSRAKRSQHLVGCAADLIIKGITTDTIFSDLLTGKIKITMNCRIILEKVAGKVWIHFGIQEDQSKLTEFLRTKDGINYIKVF